MEWLKMRNKILFIMVLMFLFSLYNISATVIYPSGLMYYYKMNNDTTSGINATDFINVKHEALGVSITGSEWENGYNTSFNKSVHIDGSADYLDTQTLGINTAFTYQAIIKHDATSGTDIFLSNLKPASLTGVDCRWGTDNKIICYLYDGTNYPSAISDNALTNGIWYRFTLTYNGTTATIYLNSTQQTGTAELPTYNRGVNTIFIGGVQSGASEGRFDGYIDEVRIWNISLNQQNISDFWSSELGVSDDVVFEISQNLTYWKIYNNSVITPFNNKAYYNIRANNNILNCSLYLNDKINLTNASISGNKTIYEFYSDSYNKDITNEGIYYWYNNSEYFIHSINFTYSKNSGLSSLCINTTFYFNNSNNFYRNTFCEDPGIEYRLNYTFNRTDFIADSFKIELYSVGTGGETHFKDLSIKGYELNSFNLNTPLKTGYYNYSINCYNSLNTLFTSGYSYFNITFYPLSLSIVSIDSTPFINGMNINNNFSSIVALVSNNIWNLSYNQTLKAYNGSNLIGSANSNILNVYTGSDYFGVINISFNITNYEDSAYYLNQYFYLNDTENPVCYNINSNSIYIGNQYSFDIECSDSTNFFLFNISCSNSFNYFEDNINQKTYVFNQSINITSNIVCDVEYCDGHTDNTLGYYEIEKVSDKKIDFKFNSKEVNSVYTEENSLIETKELTDKITFKVSFKEKANNSIRKIYYKTSEKSYYIESDKYKAWIIDSTSRTWFDLNENSKEKTNIKVFYKGYGLWEITLYTDKNNFEFESIGKLNCVKESMSLYAIEDTSVNLMNFEFTQINTWIYFIFIFFYVAMLFMAFTFKNFLIGSFAFIIGIILAFMSLSISVILTIAFFFINILLFMAFGKFSSN
jgi:hypothetical protein